MVKYTEISENSAPVITLAQAKANLNIEEDFTDDDALIQRCIAAAQSEACEYMQRAVTYMLYLDCNNFDAVELEALPEASVAQVQFLANGETEYADLPPENYKMQRKWGGNVYDLKFKSTDAHPLPALAVSDAAVKVAVAVNCPASVVQGMHLRIANFYEKREDFGEIGYNSAARALWRNFRQY